MENQKSVGAGKSVLGQRLLRDCRTHPATILAALRGILKLINGRPGRGSFGFRSCWTQRPLCSDARITSFNRITAVLARFRRLSCIAGTSAAKEATNGVHQVHCFPPLGVAAEDAIIPWQG
jgi:hypothetical protein